MQAIEDLEPVLKHMDAIIHIATSWGSPETTEKVNVQKTKAMFSATDPDKCKQILYFSTASILGENNRPFPEAGTLASPYIRSKHKAFHELRTHPCADRIQTLFPTVVIGGDGENFPLSHISQGICNDSQKLKWLRWIYVRNAFHAMHAKDIATMTVQCLDGHIKDKEIVLGQPSQTFQDAIEILCDSFGMKRWGSVELKPLRILALAKALRIKVGPWENYLFTKATFKFDTLCPEAIGLKSAFPHFKAMAEDLVQIQAKLRKRL